MYFLSLFPLLFYLELIKVITGNTGADLFNVLEIKNTPFPTFPKNTANINSSFEGPVAEFTACFRFQIESYNEQWIGFVSASRQIEYSSWFFFYDNLGWNTGTEVDGLQSAFTVVKRNIPGGGFGGGVKAFPGWHMYHMPFKVAVSKWYHSCVSYSSKLQRIHRYINGQKAFSFEFTDKEELPLPAGSFEQVNIARNMRGMLTDLHIYSSYFTDDSMVTWTTSCTDEYGDIINWNKHKITLEEHEDGPDINWVAVDKKDICPENGKPTPRQESDEIIGAKRMQRYKRSRISGPIVNSVLVLFYDLELKSNMDCVDRCLRFGGELMNFPENQEEEDLMDKTLWNFQLKAVNNNLTYLTEKLRHTGLWLGGQTKEPFLYERTNFTWETRTNSWPLNGSLELFHPLTGKRIHPHR